MTKEERQAKFDKVHALTVEIKKLVDEIYSEGWKDGNEDIILSVTVSSMNKTTVHVATAFSERSVEFINLDNVADFDDDVDMHYTVVDGIQYEQLIPKGE